MFPPLLLFSSRFLLLCRCYPISFCCLLSTFSPFLLKVVSGDYVAYVHILEVRELKGEDLQVRSDPIDLIPPPS